MSVLLFSYGLNMFSIGNLYCFLKLSIAISRRDLNSNRFTGSIPHSIGDLLKLIVLDLFNNLLDGAIPVSSGTTSGLNMLVNAKHLYVKFPCICPADLCSLSSALLTSVYAGLKIIQSSRTESALRHNPERAFQIRHDSHSCVSLYMHWMLKSNYFTNGIQQWIHFVHSENRVENRNWDFNLI